MGEGPTLSFYQNVKQVGGSSKKNGSSPNFPAVKKTVTFPPFAACEVARVCFHTTSTHILCETSQASGPAIWHSF